MSHDYKSLRFLVVEDHNEMLRTVRRMLEAMGATDIRLAADGDAAIRTLEGGAVDVVLCDYNLGEAKDGQQILEEARMRGLLPPAAGFVMITAESSVDMVLGAMDHRPDDYLIKPFNRNTLKLRIDRVLERRGELGPIEAAVAAGDLDGALARCDRALAGKTRHRLALTERKGELLVAGGAYREALELYDGVLETRELSWAAVGRGRALFHLGRIDDAEAVFDRVLAGNRLAMEAYDWLARIKEAKGSTQDAQELMARATALSPRSVHRHRRLGQLASTNGDHATAARAYRSVVRLNRHSYFRALGDHVQLAEALHASGDAAAALKALREGRQSAAGSDDEQRQARLMEADVLEALGRDDEASVLRQSIPRPPAGAGHEGALARAREAFARGDRAEATRVLERLVRDNHDDESLLGTVREVFSDAGMGEEGEALVSETRDELVSLNDQGVDLARAGRLDEAIELFRNAAEGLPANRVVNLNAAQVLVIRMRERGVDQELVRQARRYLDRVGRLDPHNPKYLGIRRRLEELAAPTPAPG